MKHNKLYTFIEVVGLAIAMSFVVFIGTYVLDSYQTDRAIKKQGNIYVGHADGFFLMSYPMKDILDGKYPEIESMCRVTYLTALQGINMEMDVAGETIRQNGIVADENFFTFFPLPLAEGEPGNVLHGNSVLLSESFARTHFPEQDPIGKEIILQINENRKSVLVSGVFKDFKNTILPQPEIIYNYDCIKELYPSLIHPGNGTVCTFYQLAPETDIELLEGKMEECLVQEDQLFGSVFHHFELCSFGDLGELEDIQNWVPFRNLTDPGLVRLFTAIGILLLLFSIINYISLSVAQMGLRAKEMAMRRLLGETRSGIIRRYFCEALILTSASFVLSVVLVELFLPYVNELMGKDLSPFSDSAFIYQAVMSVVLIVLLSFCSGIVPGWMISRFKPIDVVRGDFRRSGKLLFGKVFIGVQTFILFVTLVLAITMARQIQHMMDKPMGYDKDSIVMVRAKAYTDLYVPELQQLPCVEEVGFVIFPPIEQSQCFGIINNNGERYQVDVLYGDQNAFQILNFNLMASFFEPQDGDVYLSEAAMNSMQMTLDDVKEKDYCGVFRNIQKGSAAKEADSVPLIYYVMGVDNGKNFEYVRTMILKVSGDEKEALKSIQHFYEQKPSYEHLYISSFNKQNEYLYGSESNNLKLVEAFAFIVLLLTILSLLAMSTYYARNHTKTVAIQQVLGCSKRELYWKTCGNFLRPLLIAMPFAAVSAILLVRQWLQGYSYRIDDSVWTYVVVSILIMAIAVLSVSWQIIRLMNVNLSDNLKTE